MTELPDYYSIANAPWEQKLSWLDAEVSPYERILEAAPWYDRNEQVDWYLESMRELLTDPNRLAAIKQLLGLSPCRDNLSN